MYDFSELEFLESELVGSEMVESDLVELEELKQTGTKSELASIGEQYVRDGIQKSAYAKKLVEMDRVSEVYIWDGLLVESVNTGRGQTLKQYWDIVGVGQLRPVRRVYDREAGICQMYSSRWIISRVMCGMALGKECSFRPGKYLSFGLE